MTHLASSLARTPTAAATSTTPPRKPYVASRRCAPEHERLHGSEQRHPRACRTPHRAQGQAVPRFAHHHGSAESTDEQVSTFGTYESRFEYIPAAFTSGRSLQILAPPHLGRGERAGVGVRSLRVPQAERDRFDANQVPGLHLDLEHGCIVTDGRGAADLVDRNAEPPRQLPVTAKPAHG